jgi:hypothetical protein
MVPRHGSQYRYVDQAAATAEASIKPAVSNHGQRCSFMLRPYRFVGTEVSPTIFQA